MDNRIKLIRHRTMDYLVGLENVYRDLGYTTSLNIRDNTLEVFNKEYVLQKTQEEITLEKWIN